MRVACLLFALLACAAAPPANLLADGGFERDATWTIQDTGMSTRSREQAADGDWSLKIVDTSANGGSDAASEPVAIPGAGAYELSGRVFPVSGEGLGIYVRVLGADGRLVVAGDTFQTGAPSAPRGAWQSFSLNLTAPPSARALQVWLHSYNAASVSAYVDSLRLVRLEPGVPQPPPWPAQYKIRPDETARLTPADVVGPDGIVYPNWTRVGVPGGIPAIPTVARVEDHGGRPNDDADDRAAILAAVEAARQRGGGAVLLGPGTWHLSRPIVIKTDGIVLRGAGAARTRLLFDYDLGPDGIRLAEPEGDTLHGGTSVTLHALPTGLRSLEILANGQRMTFNERSTHWGNTYAAVARGYAILDKLRDAETITIRGVARYDDGTVRETERVLRAVRNADDPADTRRPAMDAAISFSGEGSIWKSTPIELAADGPRGAMQLTLRSTAGLTPGDWLYVDGPATPRWKELTRNKCEWGNYRQYMVRISAITGDVVHLEQPLRIEFPVIDGSRVWRIDPIRRCGIEDMTIEQTANLWISTVALSHAVECWARGVTVEKMGRFPIYGSGAKWCTIQDCRFNDAWYKGGGGTAYAGWERSFDCLMDGCETVGLRHAPCVQWAASGCVIRNSRFVGSDAQWHSGWTNENLFENCVVESTTRANGGYGFGAWASPPEDTAHGPNGPRNVVYGCDLTSERDGLWMGGMNENWLILYNRFRVGGGGGVFAKTFSFDHLIRGNVFALRDEAAAMVSLATPDCSGVEITDNVLYGGAGVVLAGASAAAVEQGNRVEAYQADPPRPTPAVPSIYAWQQANVRPPEAHR